MASYITRILSFLALLALFGAQAREYDSQLLDKLFKSVQTTEEKDFTGVLKPSLNNQLAVFSSSNSAAWICRRCLGTIDSRVSRLGQLQVGLQQPLPL